MESWVVNYNHYTLYEIPIQSINYYIIFKDILMIILANLIMEIYYGIMTE